MKQKTLILVLGTLILASCATSPKSEVREPQQVGTGSIGSLSAESNRSQIIAEERSLENLECRVHFKYSNTRALKVVEDTRRILKRKYGVQVVYGESEANVGVMVGSTLGSSQEQSVDSGPYPNGRNQKFYETMMAYFFMDKKIILEKEYGEFDPELLAQEIVSIAKCKINK